MYTSYEYVFLSHHHLVHVFLYFHNDSLSRFNSQNQMICKWEKKAIEMQNIFVRMKSNYTCVCVYMKNKYDHHFRSKCTLRSTIATHSNRSMMMMLKSSIGKRWCDRYENAISRVAISTSPIITSTHELCHLKHAKRLQCWSDAKNTYRHNIVDMNIWCWSLIRQMI